MEITYITIVFIVTYVIGAFVKAFINVMPNKYLPIQNTIIGIISGLICYFSGVEPNIVQAIVLCFIASTGAGGTADLVNMKK